MVLALLTRILTWLPALAGFTVTVALIPASTWMAKKQASIRRQVMLNTDKRVKLTSEVIAGMKAIKLYAWEMPYTQRISAVREVTFKMLTLENGILRVACCSCLVDVLSG